MVRYATGDGSIIFPAAYAALRDARTVPCGAAHSHKLILGLSSYNSVSIALFHFEPLMNSKFP